MGHLALQEHLALRELREQVGFQVHQDPLERVVHLELVELLDPPEQVELPEQVDPQELQEHPG